MEKVMDDGHSLLTHTIGLWFNDMMSKGADKYAK
jgi:hypothetical protein